MPSAFDALGPVLLSDPVDRSHPLNEGRVSWWLDVPGLDGGAKLYDLMGVAPGTLTNMTTTTSSGWKPTSRPGGYGHLAYDGTDDYVSAAATDAGLLGGLSVFAWVNFRIASHYHHIASKAVSSGAANSPIEFRTDNGGTCTLAAFRANATAYHIWSGPAVSVGVWHHVGVTCADGDLGTTPTFYIDGVPTTASSAGTQGGGTGAVTGSTAPWLIGRRGDGVVQADGAMDDIGVWSRALSAVEVRSLYELSRRGYPDILRRAYPTMLDLTVAGGGASYTLGGTATALTTTTMSDVARRPVVGTAAAQSATTAALIRRTAMAGSAAAQSATTGAVVRRAPLAGSVTGQSAAASIATNRRAPLAGQATAQSGATMADNARRPFSGTCSAGASTSGDLQGGSGSAEADSWMINRRRRR